MVGGKNKLVDLTLKQRNGFTTVHIFVFLTPLFLLKAVTVIVYRFVASFFFVPFLYVLHGIMLLIE